MRDHSFPDVAFKYNFDESSSSSSIEYCNCPNQYETAKQKSCDAEHEVIQVMNKKQDTCFFRVSGFLARHLVKIRVLCNSLKKTA